MTTSPLTSAISAQAKKRQLAYLVESLQKAHDAALNLLLVQATAGAVHAHPHDALLDAQGSSSSGARSGKGSSSSCSSDGDGSGDGADGRGGCAEGGSAEHFRFCFRDFPSIRKKRKEERPIGGRKGGGERVIVESSRGGSFVVWAGFFW